MKSKTFLHKLPKELEEEINKYIQECEEKCVKANIKVSFQ